MDHDFQEIQPVIYKDKDNKPKIYLDKDKNKIN
jgi:hypothetical protein